ncbi:MAG: FtsX-like permease family protein [Anaerolineae bacterium]|nr:FtsX-like permease family protein [Anaerolineae bacterium]
MNIGRRKAWRDLAQSKARTVLVVLSVSVGVFALGLVFGLSSVMRLRMTQDHLNAVPAHILFAGGPFDRDVVSAVSAEANVAQVEARTEAGFRWKREGETDWRPGTLIARSAYADIRMERLELMNGAWPDADVLAVERQSAAYFGLGAGTTILAEYGKREKPVAIEGLVRSSSITPPQFGGNATFYTTAEQVTSLAGLAYPNRLSVRLESFSVTGAELAAKRVQDRLERMGVQVIGYLVSDPSVHPLQSMVDTMALVLTLLGALSLGLSAFLIINTTRSLVIQQVWQIGVMKVYGATSRRLVRMYLLMVLIYGVFAALLAIPTAALATHWVSIWLLDLINIAASPFSISLGPMLIQSVIGLLVPALAALGPIIKGARVTPREAISTQGIGDQFGGGWLDQAIGRLRGLPRPLALSLRNTFRRKARVLLTLLTLVAAGLMFITVMSLGSSLRETLNTLIAGMGLDVWVVFPQPERGERLIEIAVQVPGIAHAEMWDQRAGRITLTGGGDEEVYLLGVPTDSSMFNPQIIRGRMLLPEDDYAILLNSKIATDEGIGIGEQVEVTIDQRVSRWTVVGLVVSITDQQRDSFVPLSTLSREMGDIGRGTVLMLKTDRAADQQLKDTLQDTFRARGFEPSFLLSATEIRQQSQAQFNIILSLMFVMATLAAVVGSLGLTGTLSINVIERTREIGVMRSIGASSRSIISIFLVEGVMLGVLSWLVSAPLSYPGARLFGGAVGTALLQAPLEFRYSTGGTVLWLIIVCVLSSLASVWPASKAASIRIVEALRFE